MNYRSSFFREQEGYDIIITFYLKSTEKEKRE